MSKPIDSSLLHTGMESPFRVPGLRPPPPGHEPPDTYVPHELDAETGKTAFQTLVEIVTSNRGAECAEKEE